LDALGVGRRNGTMEGWFRKVEEGKSSGFVQGDLGGDKFEFPSVFLLPQTNRCIPSNHHDSLPFHPSLIPPPQLPKTSAQLCPPPVVINLVFFLLTAQIANNFSSSFSQRAQKSSVQPPARLVRNFGAPPPPPLLNELRK
jgi:hypothetical protein